MSHPTLLVTCTLSQFVERTPRLSNYGCVKVVVNKTILKLLKITNSSYPEIVTQTLRDRLV